ncbi:hypothetical protein JHK82_043079 [Glycine max]|nr:hypothetical protein JHK85_043748 [Glycine max]KAG5106109.1 hypothetical protein JHK82_043079 [Glycine max]
MSRCDKEELSKLKVDHDELEAHVRRPQGDEYSPYTINERTQVDLPLGWKPLNLEHCDGTTNLDEHLDVFLTQTNLYTNDNAILCRVFPTSLKGVTLTWYRGLPHIYQ